MSNRSFIKQYIKKPRIVGAILPSSPYLADKMIEDINFEQCSCIVEYGAGTGVFTENLIKNKKQDTVVIIIECNNKFYDLLRKRYMNLENVYIINDSAENIDAYLEKFNIHFVDYVISGLPFASLPKDVSKNILNKTQRILSKEGKFITFQYTLFKKNFIREYFNKISIKFELKNVPPAFVLKCSK